MAEYVFTVDTGTTNTRVILWDENREVVGIAKREVGVRNTAIDGDNHALKAAVRDCLETLLGQAGIGYGQVKHVIASGMITSNVGLVEIPHLVAPVSMRDLAAGIRDVLCEDVCPVPISFIPGVKNRDGGDVDLSNFEEMDIMRGEEVETAAILAEYPAGQMYILVLPGSHTKFVAVDAQGRITGCLTSITGELLNSITNDTIIADAVGRQYVTEQTYDRQMMLLGYAQAAKCGIGRACFSARILNQFAVGDKAKLANYILGACLQSDVAAVRNSAAISAGEDATIVVAGKNPFRQALADIFVHEGCFRHVETFVPTSDVPLSPIGAYRIADLRGV